jgi:hypothetical protein
VGHLLSFTSKELSNVKTKSGILFQNRKIKSFFKLGTRGAITATLP